MSTNMKNIFIQTTGWVCLLSTASIVNFFMIKNIIKPCVYSFYPSKLTWHCKSLLYFIPTGILCISFGIYNGLIINKLIENN